MAKSWNVLVVEDSPEDYEMVVRTLTREGCLGESRCVETMESLVEAIGATPWDVVLCDYNIPGVEFEACVALIREYLPTVPVIVVSGGIDAGEAVPLLRQGVSDFVSKDVYTRLLPCIERCLAEQAERVARVEAEAALTESRRFAQLTLDALSTHIAVLDQDGCILAVNRAWRDFATANGVEADAVSEGVNYLDVCDRAGAAGRPVGTLIREVARGECPEVGYEYPCHGPSEERWFLCRITRFSDDGPVRIVITHKNTTELKQVDLELRRRESNLLTQRNALIALSNLTSGARGDSKAAFREVTETASRTAGVARLSIWKLNPERNAITCLDLYDAQSDTHIEGMELEGQDYPAYFSAILEGQIIAANDAMQDPMTREFSEEYLPSFGIASMMDVPIHLGGMTCGVLCYEHVGTVREWNTDEKTFAVAIATQVSTLLEQSERRQAEEQLRLQSAALNATSNSVLITHVDATIIWANPAFLALSGYELDEVLGASAQRFVETESYRPGFFDHIWSDINAGNAWSGQVVCRRKDGTSYTESQTISPIRDNAGKVTHIVAVKEDVTERIESEKRLWKARERLDRAIDAGNIVLWEWDLESGVVEHSEAWVPSDALDDGDGTGFHMMEQWMERVHQDDVGPLRQLFEDCKRTAHRTFQKEFRSRFSDQRYNWYLVGAMSDVDEFGSVVRIIGTIMDITDRKRLEVEYQQSQKMESIGRLAGGVAHDFNNLLGVIGGYSEFALEDLPEESPLRENVLQIKRASERAADLTRQLLAFSRRQMLQPEVINLNEVVADTEKMLRRVIGEDISLEISSEEELGQIMADPGQMEQILMNLVVNARDAMPRGGKLAIRTENVTLSDEEALHLPGGYPGSYVALQVKDSGLGMDQRTSEQIFEPFFTTKEKGKGTGLGLATVYGIVKQSGGCIWVDSVLGEGTTFDVLFPRIDGAVPVTQSDNVPLGLARGEETILLIEDESALRAVTRILLNRMGYKVLDAEDGDTALALFGKNSVKIDMVLSDVVMPGKSGPETVELLQAMDPELKVLFMSGYAADTIAHHGALHDDVEFINKPFSFQDLTRRIRSLLDAE